MYLDTVTIAGRRVTLEELAHEPIADKRTRALIAHLRAKRR